MRHLQWEACYNVRDLGGFTTEDGGQTRWRALVRSDNLCRLSAAGRQALINYGVRTIIDLRYPEELAREPNPFANSRMNHGTNYLNLPPLNEGVEEIAAAFKGANSMFARYCIAYDYGREGMANAVNAIAEAPEGAVLVHCYAGKDRTGRLVALLLALAGVPYETIAEDYAESDIRLKPLLAGWINEIADPTERQRAWADIANGRQMMRNVLLYLDQKYGDAEEYLRGGGVTEDNLTKIRKRLVEQ